MQTGPKKTTALALTCALAGLTTGCPTHETDTVHKLDQIENRANRLTNEAACLELQRALALTGIDPAPDQNPEHKYTAEVSHGSHTGECSLQVWQKKIPSTHVKNAGYRLTLSQLQTDEIAQILPKSESPEEWSAPSVGDLIKFGLGREWQSLPSTIGRNVLLDHYHANFAERQIGGVDIQTKQGIMRETHHTNCKQDGQWQFYCEKTISSTFYLRAPGEIVNFQVKTYPEHLGDKISQETPSNLAGTTIHVDEYAWLTAPSLPYTAEELEQNPVLSLNQ